MFGSPEKRLSRYQDNLAIFRAAKGAERDLILGTVQLAAGVPELTCVLDSSTTYEDLIKRRRSVTELAFKAEKRLNRAARRAKIGQTQYTREWIAALSGKDLVEVEPGL